VKIDAFPAYKFSNFTAPSASFALTWNPAHAGLSNENTAPRTEFLLKKSGGKLLGEEKLAGTASQLISRRPFASPVAPGAFNGPSAAWSAVTAGRIAAGSAPAAPKIDGCA
jgi:hypothetical protein